MKYIVIIGDGMADRPLKELGDRTPLQVASKQNMDRIAEMGKSGLLKTIPEGMGAGSDVANLSILGYNPKRYYTGRGPLEAMSAGVKLREGDVAFRCNIITEKDGELLDYSAGHISTEEAGDLIKGLNRSLGSDGTFYPGVSYRHLFVLNDGDKLICSPPHDVMGGKINEHLIRPVDDPIAIKLNEMILKSKDVLTGHPVNLRRIKAGKRPGNMIWLWGQGRKPRMETFEEKFGIRGMIVSAVDLLKGIGTYTGMEIPDVPGATGYYDTDYRAKADAALKALERLDYVYVHVEAIDEAGHAGDTDKKIATIEEFDEKLVGRILDKAEDAKIAVLPDHVTPISIRTHSRDPVPFSIYTPGGEGDGLAFDEDSARKGSIGYLEGPGFMKLLLGA
ncbi:MAG: cofactor-independent phosphoglycerate mutase [Candidatus Hydrothermarchaeaceae archaeon]